MTRQDWFAFIRGYLTGAIIGTAIGVILVVVFHVAVDTDDIRCIVSVAMMTTQQLAARFGVTAQTVGFHLHAAGVSGETKKSANGRGRCRYWPTDEAIAALEAVRCGQPGKRGRAPGTRLNPAPAPDVGPTHHKETQ